MAHDVPLDYLFRYTHLPPNRAARRSEEEIERMVEHAVDRLDRLYLGSAMTSEDYELEMAAIDAWANIERHFPQGD